MFWFVVLAGIIALNVVLYSRVNNTAHWILGLIALGPFYMVWLACAGQKQTFPRGICALLIVISPFCFVGVVMSQGMLAMHNGYPLPLLIVPGMWLVGAAFVIFFPFQSLFKEQRFDAYRRWALVLTGGSVVALFVMNLAFTQFVQLRAASQFGRGGYCITENNGASFQRTLWISPGKILFRNEWKGVTNAHFLAGSLDGSKTHHWSFWAMDFLENESSAFVGNPSFWRAGPDEKLC